MQNKTPGEVAAILKEWHEVNERCKQKAGETEELMLECDRLLEKIRCHLFEYAVRAMSFSPTIDSNNLSMVELILRNGAMEHDRKAGAATWALYETQKKLQDFCNAFEELQTFHAEYVSQIRRAKSQYKQQPSHSPLSVSTSGDWDLE
jgi:hypothetical protein